MSQSANVANTANDTVSVLSGYPAALRDALLELRALILEVALETEAVGRLEETLKWGQPSYLTPATKSGTTRWKFKPAK